MRGTAKLVLGTMVASAALLGADPFLGTWKLSLAKSQFGSRPAPKSSTITCASEKGGASKCTHDGVNAQGQPTHYEYTAKTDSKDYPVTGSPLFDAISFNQVDSRTRDITAKKAGQVVGTVRLVISKDGKTSTATWNAKDPEGKPQTWTTVSERQ